MPRRGENIYHRKDNRWEARYVKSHTASGKILYGYCYGKTYREAKQKAELAKQTINDGPHVSTGKIGRFSDYCNEWMELSENKVRESTYVKYLSMMEKHIRPNLGSLLPRQLTTLVVDRFSRELLETGLAPKTVRDILTVLRSVLRYISRQYPGLLGPVDISYPREMRKEMRVLTPEEQNRLINYLLIDMDECKFGILLALFTGLRIGELCALRWQNISLIDRTIHVSSTMQRIKNLDDTSDARTRVMISDPKSNTSSRIIPLAAQAADLCRRWDKGQPTAYVLTGESGRYMEPRNLQYRLQNYTRACKLEGVHFHVLRHTFATRCVEAGFEIKSLSEILGHSSPQITLERYVHSSLELKRANMEKLDWAWTNSRQ